MPNDDDDDDDWRPQADDVEDSPASPDGVSTDNGKDSSTLPVLTSIWEDLYVEDHGKGWKCGHCGVTFSQRNATKALCHLAKRSGYHISICKAKHPDPYAERYKLMLDTFVAKKAAKKRATTQIEEGIIAGQTEAEAALQAKRPRKYGDVSAAVSTTSNSTLASASVSSRRQYGVQPTIDVSCGNVHVQVSVKASNEALLDMACADLCHADGLAWNVPSKPRFKRVMNLAKCVDSSWTPPDARRVSGELLDLNYKRTQEKNDDALASQAHIFGISFFGDGATIKRSPYINILGSGVVAPSVVLEIHDCTPHLLGGGIKDAPYIASLFEKHLKRHDPKKEVTELVIFDGAGNVQKGGRILEAKYPRISTIHGSMVYPCFSTILRNSRKLR